MKRWFAQAWVSLVLTAIVIGACGLALAWVFLVPIYQSPDEPLHLDYALCIRDHGGLFRAKNIGAIKNDPACANFYRCQCAYLCYFVHPYTPYLIEQSEHVTIWANQTAKVPPGYGSRAYFESVDRGAPARKHIPSRLPPALVFAYPFGYYTLLAGWLECLRWCTHSLIGLFFGARILSVILLAISLPLVHATLREMHFRAGRALLLTACIGCLPLTSFVSSYVQPDNLSFTLVSLCFYLTLRARRDIAGTRILAGLGLALGALLVTKQHYYLCVLVPAACMLAAELLFRRDSPRHWMRLAGLVLGPSLLTGSVYLWTIWGLPHNPLPRSPNAGSLVYNLEAFRKALSDFYAGTTHQSFWGLFGWMEVPLVIGGQRTDSLVKFLLHAAAWTFLALTLVRLEQVAARLIRLARRGRYRLTLRMIFSNAPLNSYFLFTVFMFYLYMRTDNYFGAQGRNWLPFLMPIFVTSLAYAPKALSMRRSRALIAACAWSGLVLYTLLGSYYALRVIKERYYAPGYDQAMVETPLTLEPASLNQMTWKQGAGDGLGDDPFLVFQLERPTYVHCLRLKYRLTNQDNQFAAFQTFWKETGRNDFDGAQRNTVYRLRAGPEENMATIWINDTVDCIRIDPDQKPCHFEIEEMSVFRKP